MKTTSKLLIQQLSEDTQAIIDFTNASLTKLSSEKLNQKPSEEKWSVAECLEHLNLYGDYYIPAIKNAINQGKNTSPSPNYKGSWFGNYFTKSMLPKENAVKNKMKTFKDKNPIHSQVPSDVLERFLNQQNEILALLQQAQSVNLMKPKISITIAKWLKIRLGDTFRFVIAHNQRHIVQAKKVLEVIQS